MSNIIVTCPGRPEALIVRAAMSIHIGQRIAEAFTPGREYDYELHELLVMNFGEHCYKWYCIDMSSDIFEVTFSDRANPRVLEYQGAAASVATADRRFFSLRLQAADMIKPGRINPRAPHPSFIG